MYWRFLTICFFTLLVAPALNGQEYNYPLDQYHQYYLDIGQARTDSTFTTAFRSLPESWYNLDSVRGYRPVKEPMYSSLAASILRDHHFTIDEKDLTVHVDALVHFELGSEMRNTTAYSDTSRFSRNTRGFLIKGSIGERFSFETSFREDQTMFPEYLIKRIRGTISDEDGAFGVAPGGGRIKSFNVFGYDNSIAQGYVSYSPTEAVNLQFGHQKNFVGSGYRSLLLSDNSYTYPQLKMSFSLLKSRINYHSIMGTMLSLRRLPLGDTPESLFQRKGVSFHFFEFRPSTNMSIGLFEGVTWKRYDEVEGSLTNPIHRYVPVIGLNSAINGLDEEHNSVIGVDFGYCPLSSAKLYGQYMIDRENHEGYQLGLKLTDLPLDDLWLQFEYNSIDPYTYAHSNAQQSYTHLNQPIAHPRGAGVDELSIGAMYLYRRWFLNARYTRGEQRLEIIDSTNVGSNINLALGLESLIETPSVSQSDYVLFKLGYMVNPTNNTNLYFSWLYRDERNTRTDFNQSLISFGLVMDVWNRYEDL